MSPVLLSLGEIKIYSFGVMLALGVLLGSFVAWKKAREYHIEEDKFFDVMMLVVMGGFLGGRLFYVVEHLAIFADRWLRTILVFAYPGLSWWGALLVGSIVLWWQVRKSRDVHLWFDLGALGVSLGLVWGRVGSLLNGSMVGMTTSSVLGVNMVGVAGKVWPVQIGEAVLMLILFKLLWHWEGSYRTFFWYRGGKSFARTGFLFYSFLIGVGMVLGLSSFGYSWSSAWVAGFYRGAALASVLVGVGGLYSRSGRNLEEDLGFKKLAR